MKFLHIEAEHRLTDNLSVSFEANKAIDPASGSLFYDTRQDGYAEQTFALSW